MRAAETAARRFGSGRAWRDTVRIWEEARWMDTRATYRAAEVAACILRDAGIEDVRIEDVPSDGHSAWNGWLMPLAWEVKEARLERGGRSRNRESFADYAIDPQSIAVWSPPTPDARFVEGPIVRVDRADQLKGVRVRDCFVYLQTGKGSIDLNADAARRGALGILTAIDGPTPTARAFLNYHVPMDSRRPCIPHFSLSREAGHRLNQHLIDDPGFRVRARVRARRHAGTAPMLTGTIGSGTPEVYLCAHIDEIGALDNASGCGVALEALRTLHRLRNARDLSAPLRAIRFFFSTEIRGQQAWFNTRQSPTGFLGGMNLDMVGSGSSHEPVVGRLGFPHRNHFAGRLLADAMAMANRIVPGLPIETGANYVSDGIPGIHATGGNVSIEQRPGPTYHTSADTPSRLNRNALHWSGAATVAWLYAMTRMDGGDALRIARHIKTDMEANRSEDSTPARAERSRREMGTLLAVMPPGPDHDVAGTSSGRVDDDGQKRNRLCPGDRQRGTLQSLIQGVSTPNEKTAAKKRRKKGCLLVMRDVGYLNFDTIIDPKDRRTLKEATGLEPSWCTDSWAWIAATFFDGKHTLPEVMALLSEIGIDVDMDRLQSLAACLVDLGLARDLS